MFGSCYFSWVLLVLLFVDTRLRDGTTTSRCCCWWRAAGVWTCSTRRATCRCRCVRTSSATRPCCSPSTPNCSSWPRSRRPAAWRSSSPSASLVLVIDPCSCANDFGPFVHWNFVSFFSSDITRGKEPSPIQCVNGFDDEAPPDDYVYITENCFTSPLHVERTINSLQVRGRRARP